MARRLSAAVLALSLGVLTACDSGAEEAAVTTDVAPASATVDPRQTASAEPEETTSAPATEEGEPTAAALPDGPVTALLVGTDSRDGDLAGMSDVIVIAQLSEDHEHLTLVSVPRDSSVEIPGHGRDKVNAAFAEGGTPLLQQTVSNLMGGLQIDLVAQTNFEMFTSLTRWMDGFWVDNQHASTVTVGSTGRQVVFEEGRIFLEDTDGLVYVRERNDLPLGDLDRTERHRAALVGMMERLVEIRAQDPAKLLELLPILHQNVKVEGDLQLAHLMTMVEVGAGLGADDVTSLMVPVSHYGSSEAGASINVLDEPRTAELAEGLREGDLSGYVERYGASYAPTGG